VQIGGIIPGGVGPGYFRETANKTANTRPLGMITHSQINAAIKVATSEKRRVELRDESERGGGRLVLVTRPLRKHTVSEWYALYYRDAKRRFTKIGSYPTLSLADARTRFREEYVPTIVAGAEPKNRFARVQHMEGSPDISVRDLFQAYVDHLKKARKVAWYQVERILLKREDNAAAALGADRAAKAIEPQTIVSYLADIHVRRGVGMAHNIRAYISSAYSFGIKSAHNYTRREVIGKWDIKVNPVAAIPTDPAALKVGERFLTIVEFRTFWEWLTDNYQRSSMAPALHLMMATGQRVQEILCLTSWQYDLKERLVFWDKTKNGLPHSLPLPGVAARILDELPANEFGLFFPHRTCPERHALHTGPNKLCALYSSEASVNPFTPRDLRRTWKTLAGRAGVSKELRDRLQNHTKADDVSARHYDRYDYLPERRAAMQQWESFLERILHGELDGSDTAALRSCPDAPRSSPVLAG
jgi:integrase